MSIVNMGTDRLALGTGLATVSVAVVALYRLCFHPLAKVPGPFWNAVSRYRLFHWGFFQDGITHEKILELHEEYGPIVRIAPNEIHLSDPADFDLIYKVGSVFNKDWRFCQSFGPLHAIFNTVSNTEHRQRRAPLNPFFSRRSVLDQEALVQEKAAKLCARVKERLDKGIPADIHSGFRAVGIDVVTDYAFDDCWDMLDQEDFGEWFPAMNRTASRGWVFTQHFVVMTPPLWFVLKRAMKHLENVSWFPGVTIVHRSSKHVEEVVRKIADGDDSKERSIVHQLLAPKESSNGKAPLTPQDLADETSVILGAASETTGTALTIAAYHVIKTPHMYQRLRAELLEAFPDEDEEPSFLALEKLPYLTAIIKEALRMEPGLPGRLQRSAPAGGVLLQGHFIPEGTTVSMSSHTQHRNSVIFPNPRVFDPTRWMDQPKDVAQSRENSLVPFSRGTRQCLGINLAYCELYVTLGTFFRRFGDLKAPGVIDEDMEFRDFFAAFPAEGANLLKVVREASV
ncbi:cytochrome P450 [Stachybotrys elegans]|uniref:Cytochrome P450 n=1 Tax=Stachybotrys elegans TaxID=80388 RepID=A0A8K0WNN4_9HYPO|nr:cytochrome P450 [Stachybotrys elegans]